MEVKVLLLPAQTCQDMCTVLTRLYNINKTVHKTIYGIIYSKKYMEMIGVIEISLYQRSSILDQDSTFHHSYLILVNFRLVGIL